MAPAAEGLMLSARKFLLRRDEKALTFDFMSELMFELVIVLNFITTYPFTNFMSAKRIKMYFLW